MTNFFKSFPPVTQFILLVAGHLRKRPVKPVGNKDRIVAEPCFSLGFRRNTALYFPEKSFDCSVRKSQCHAADEPRRPLFRGCILQFGKKFFVIPDSAPVAVYPRIPRRIYARRPVQRIYLKAGIVSQSRFARAGNDFDSFLDCVPLERVPVFKRFGAVRIIIKRQNRDRKACNDAFYLFDLFFIPGGENEFHFCPLFPPAAGISVFLFIKQERVSRKKRIGKKGLPKIEASVNVIRIRKSLKRILYLDSCDRPSGGQVL